jgi:chromosomal replication initiation ATPase DnaA
MKDFIEYLSKKYQFNIDDETLLFREVSPIKSSEDIFEYMLSEICFYSEFSPSQVLGKTRKREIVYARHLLAFFLMKSGAFSLTRVGQKIGGRNHATIINSKRVAEDLLSVKDEIMYPLYLKTKHLIHENNTSSSPVKL